MPEYKIFHLLVPKPGQTDEQFRIAWDAYAAELAPLAEAAQGFHYYVRTPRSEKSSSLSEFHGHGYSYDGVDVVAFGTAAAALAFKATMIELSAGFVDESSTCVVTREHILVNGAPIGPVDSGPGIKVITSLRRISELSLEDFRYRWLNSHGPYVVDTQGIGRYIQNHVITDEYLSGEPRYDGFVEVWHRIVADQTATFGDPMMTDVQAADIPQFIDTSTFFAIQCTDDEQWVTGERPHRSISSESKE